MKTFNIDDLYTLGEVYPPREQIFRAIELCPIGKTKVCILGQDPYHGPGQANGLAFSVNKGVKIPPSLQNIYRELSSDLNLPLPEHGDLTSWAKEGVLLLNSILTVERGRPLSHAGRGTEAFARGVLRSLVIKKNPVVFILWGKQAQSYLETIIGYKGESLPCNYKIIQSPHPSPFSAHKGFFGSRPFSTANAFLLTNGVSPVDWSIK